MSESNRSRVVVNTNRLTLRRYLISDVQAIHTLTSDSTVREYVGNLPTSLEEAWSRLLRSEGHWSVFGYGQFAVVDKESDQIIGEVGVGHYHRGIDQRLNVLPEASWFFRRESHGKGYAFEAMSAVMEWIETRPTYEGLACLIDPSNKPSLNLAERLKFQIEAEVSYRDRMFHLLTRL